MIKVLSIYAVHLYRFNKTMSRRDISPKSAEFITLEDAQALAEGTGVKVWYVVADLTGSVGFGVGGWHTLLRIQFVRVGV